MQRVRSFCAVVIVLATSCAGIGFSQTVNATLLGNVTDVSGAVIPNVKVTITEVNTGVNRAGQTNDSGNYSFTNLPPGIYSVDSSEESVGEFRLGKLAK